VKRTLRIAAVDVAIGREAVDRQGCSKCEDDKLRSSVGIQVRSNRGGNGTNPGVARSRKTSDRWPCKLEWWRLSRAPPKAMTATRAKSGHVKTTDHQRSSAG
jgi:hypothetical protein